MPRAHRLRCRHAAGVFGMVAALAIAAATIPVTAALADAAPRPPTIVGAATASHAPRPDDPAALVRAAAWRAETSVARITTPLDVRLATPPAWAPALLLVAGLLLMCSRTPIVRDVFGRLPGRRAPPLASA
jgi:MoxR-like ATPase